MSIVISIANQIKFRWGCEIKRYPKYPKKILEIKTTLKIKILLHMRIGKLFSENCGIFILFEIVELTDGFNSALLLPLLSEDICNIFVNY